MPNQQLTKSDGLNPKGQAKLLATALFNKFIKPTLFKTNEDKMAVEQGVIADKTSWMGTPVFDMLSIPPFNYTDNDGNAVNISAAINFYSVILEVNQTKNIVTTAVQGRNGTVKEYISDGDYQISINGVITSQYNNVAPFEQDIAYMNSVFAMLRGNVAIPVSCSFLDMFQINSMVVMDYKFGQVEGARNTISFSMNCLSDEPFEIKYTAKQTSVPRF